MQDFVTFYFDPACPWTWVTSRWLIAASKGRGVSIKWRPLSLTILNEPNIPEQYQDSLAASQKALRVVAALAEEERENDIASFYSALGEIFHLQGRVPLASDLVSLSEKVGGPTLVAALEDLSLEDKVRGSHEYALSLSGGDTGSPVLQFGDGPGIYGPILLETMGGPEAEELFDHVKYLALQEKFSEVKRGRSGPPRITM